MINKIKLGVTHIVLIALLIGVVFTLAILVYNYTRPKSAFDTCYEACIELIKDAPKVTKNGVEMPPQSYKYLCADKCQYK